MPGWNATHIPDQSGRTAVVTGANGGIGYITARELARRGASVVLACRSAARGKAAEIRLRAEVPGAEVEFIALDLADLASVREFTHELSRRFAAAGSAITAAAAHPGYASTNLHAGATQDGGTLYARGVALANDVVAQPATGGALPTLYAATAPGVGQDAFVGPRFGWRGAPVRSWRAKWTLDDKSGERLWAASEKLTGVSYASLPR
ncbi:SDR family NAD(P)-dependent oxidoreductase [Streptomyces sp. NPDC058525]|uniref:SDR family NAD(P)-dependent oxidoreductase n=1 Tax=Streptomyces sp. NPDC058525 TaxID=3346538 RepID=UPI00365183C6